MNKFHSKAGKDFLGARLKRQEDREVCVCVFVHVSVWVGGFVSLCMYVGVCMCVCVRESVYVCICLCVSVCVCMCVYLSLCVGDGNIDRRILPVITHRGVVFVMYYLLCIMHHI